MSSIWKYIKENKNVIYVVLGQATLAFFTLTAVYYVITFIINLPGFQFDPLLLILVAFLGWQFWRILDRQTKIIEKQNDLIESMSKLSQSSESKLALRKKRTPKK